MVGFLFAITFTPEISNVSLTALVLVPLGNNNWLLGVVGAVSNWLLLGDRISIHILLRPNIYHHHVDRKSEHYDV